MSNAIEEFATRHGLDAAALAAQVGSGHWPTVADYLRDHGCAGLSREDLDAITALVSDHNPMWAMLAASEPEAPAVLADAPAPQAIQSPPEPPRSYATINAGLRESWGRQGLPPCPTPAPRQAGPETVAAVKVMPSEAEHPGTTAAADAWGRVLAGINGG